MLISKFEKRFLYANHFIVDDKGKKVSVIVPYKDYEKMMRALEDAADERAYDRAMRGKEKSIPIEQAFKEIRESHKKAKAAKRLYKKR